MIGSMIGIVIQCYSYCCHRGSGLPTWKAHCGCDVIWWEDMKVISLWQTHPRVPEVPPVAYSTINTRTIWKSYSWTIQHHWRWWKFLTHDNGSTCFREIFTSRGDICSHWSFSMRSTLTELDVLSLVCLLLQQVVHCQIWQPMNTGK